MELGNHEEANEELELIDAPLRVHPDVLEVRWLIYQKVENWELCKDIGTALVKLAPERTTGWIHRSFAQPYSRASVCASHLRSFYLIPEPSPSTITKVLFMRDINQLSSGIFSTLELNGAFLVCARCSHT